jgi:hypothetical protein
MRTLYLWIALSCLATGAWAAEEPLPAGALQRGTLANQQLVADTKLGVASKVATMGCTTLGDVATYVTQLPTGNPGSRRWKELWIVSGCNHQYPVNIEFAESGKDADWTIR